MRNAKHLRELIVLVAAFALLQTSIVAANRIAARVLNKARGLLKAIELAEEVV